jgi:hypothetical protein
MKNSIRKRSHYQSRVRWIVSATLILIALGVVTREVRADSSCAPVHGTYTSVQTTQGCTSPTGICFVGTITGAAILNGTVTFEELDQAPSAGMPLTEPGTTVSYSGTLTISTKNGTLVSRDLGVIDGERLAFTELERPVGGTGIFANAGSSNFFISGSMNSNLTAFQGTLSGVVCSNGT